MIEENPLDELENEPTDKVGGEIEIKEQGEQKQEGQEEQQEEDSYSKRVRKTITRYTRRAGEAERKAEEAVKEKEALAERIKSLEERLSIKQEPDLEDYVNPEAYRRDVKQWEQQKEQEIRNRIESESREEELKRRLLEQSQSIAQNYASQRTRDIKDDPDLEVNEEILSGIISDYGAVEMQTAIMSSDVATKLVSYLGKNDDLAEDIAKMTTVKQLKEIYKLETKLGAKPVKKESNAPAPASRVRVSASTPASTGVIRGKDESWTDYLQRRKKMR